MGLASFQRMRALAAIRQGEERAVPTMPGMNSAEQMREILKRDTPEAAQDSVMEYALRKQREVGNNPASTVTLEGGHIVDAHAPDEDPEQYSAERGYAPPTSIHPGTEAEGVQIAPATELLTDEDAGERDEDPDKYSAERGYVPPTSVPEGEAALSTDRRSDRDEDKQAKAEEDAARTTVGADVDLAAASTASPDTTESSLGSEIPTEDDLARLEGMRRDDMAAEARRFGVDAKRGMTKGEIYEAVADRVQR